MRFRAVLLHVYFRQIQTDIIAELYAAQTVSVADVARRLRDENKRRIRVHLLLRFL